MRQGPQRAILPVHAPVQSRVFDGRRHARGDQAEHGPVLLAVGFHARRLDVEHAHQLAPGRHRHGQLAANGVQRVQIARVLGDVFDQHGFAARGGGSDDALAERNRQAAHNFFAVPDGVPDGERVRALAVQQDGEHIVGNHFLHDGRDGGELLRQIERLGADARHFEQEIEQLGALAEAKSGTARGGHDCMASTI